MSEKMPPEIDPAVRQYVIFLGCLVFVIALIIAIFTVWAVKTIPSWVNP